MSLLVANLDAEVEWAGGRPEDLSPKAREMAVTAGSLMRALAEEGDAVWTVGPLDPARVPAVDGLPEVTWRHGQPGEVTEDDGLGLAWAETPRVARWREAWPGRVAGGKLPVDGDAPQWGLLHQLEPADPELARQLHHRSFQLECARKLLVALPGARLVSTPEEVLEHLAAGGADASPDGRFVLKAGWSAAGRSRWIGRADLPTRELLHGIRGQLDRHGAPALFEPWLDRVDDLSVVGAVGEESCFQLGLHRQIVDTRGRFRGLDVVPPGLAVSSAMTTPEQDEEHGLRLREMAEDVGAALHAKGYRGPYGIDAWRHRDEEGAVRIHPLGEINVRLTMGHLACALRHRLSAHHDDDPRSVLRFRLGTVPAAAPAGASLIPLLANGPRGEPGAWATVSQLTWGED